MGGIIGKFFHQFGITIVAAVLISMFVSFTLDPMLSSIWHDPAIACRTASRTPSRRFYDRTIGRVTGWFDRATECAGRRLTRASCAGRWRTGWPRWRWRSAIFVASICMVPLLGTEFVPKADFSETTRQLLHAGRLLAGSDRGQGAAGRGHHARIPGSAATRWPPSTPAPPRARTTPPSTCGWSTATSARAASDQMSAPLRERLQAGAGHHRHARRPARRGGRQQADGVLAAGPRPEGTGAADRALVTEKAAAHPRPGRPGLQRQARQAGDRRRRASATPRPTWACRWRRSPARCARWWPARRVGNWRAPDDQTYDVNVRLAPEARNAAADLERLPFAMGSQRRRQRRASCA